MYPQNGRSSEAYMAASSDRPVWPGNPPFLSSTSSSTSGLATIRHDDAGPPRKRSRARGGHQSYEGFGACDTCKAFQVTSITDLLMPEAAPWQATSAE